MFERCFDLLDVLENIRMIEFEIVDNGCLRQIMNKLASLVEKGSVIFVSLKDEPIAVREPRALAEVIRNPTNEIAGVQAIVFENPGQKRRRRGFAMRPAHDQRPFPRMKNSFN